MCWSRAITIKNIIVPIVPDCSVQYVTLWGQSMLDAKQNIQCGFLTPTSNSDAMIQLQEAIPVKYLQKLQAGFGLGLTIWYQLV